MSAPQRAVSYPRDQACISSTTCYTGRRRASALGHLSPARYSTLTSYVQVAFYTMHTYAGAVSGRVRRAGFLLHRALFAGDERDCDHQKFPHGGRLYYSDPGQFSHRDEDPTGTRAS